MHYSPINAITAASPASASPSSSSVSPSSHIYQSHHGQHHLSGNDHSIHSMGEQNELMATAAAVSHHMSSDGMNSGSPITFVTTKVEPCDDLSPTNSTTYTTLQTASTPGTQNTQNSHQNGGHHHHHYNTDHPMAGPTSNGTPKSGNGSNKRNGTTATKSSYNSHNKSGNGDHSRSSSSTGPSSNSGRVQQGGGKKTKGRVKIKMEFIDNKLRRYTTFSKRKTGIMKKAYELSTLTGTQVMLLVASETGHVYTFATRKLQPMITSDAGKALIQTCLNSPDPTGLINGNGGSGNNSGTTGPDVVTTNGHVSSLLGSSSSSSPSSNGVGPSSSSSSSMNNNHLSQNGDNHSELARLVMANGTGRGSISGCSTPNTVVDQRMSATGFEETDLSYSVSGEDCSPLNDKHLYHASPAPSTVSTLSSSASSSGSCATASSPPTLLSMSANGGGGSSANVLTQPDQQSNSSMFNDHQHHQHHHHHQQQQQQHQPMSTDQNHGHHHHQHYYSPNSTHSFTTLNSAATNPSSNGGSMLTSQSSGVCIPPMSSVITTPTSVSSFFSSFGGSGNSPPPLTPNGILSGLHSFLFADSGALGLDAFDIGSSTDVACLLPSTNPQYILPNTQPASGQVTVPSSSQAAVTTGLNPVSSIASVVGNNSSTNIRLPPFCTI